MHGSCGPAFGSALSAAPVGFSVAAITAILMASALIGMLVFGRYTQRETVDGYLAVIDGEVRVFPQAAGIVDQLLVREGQRVVAGTPLFIMQTSRKDAMPMETSEEILEDVIGEKRALDSQAREQREYFLKESQRLRRSLESAAQLVATMRGQVQLANWKRDIARRNLQRARQLHDKGHISERDLDALSVAVIDSDLAVQTSEFRLAELDSGAQDARSRLDQLQNLKRIRLAEIAESTSRLTQRLAVLRAGLAQFVVAPVDGEISALHVTRGQTVLNDTLALSIVPTDARLCAELFVPGRSIGMLKGHPRIDLRFDAYPFEKFGSYGAVVEQQARSLLLPGDARLPVRLTEPVYRIRATLDQQHVNIGGSKRALTPGLTFKADILLSNRSLLEWLMAPVIGAGKRL
jgi:membrane fusion protein